MILVWFFMLFLRAVYSAITRGVHYGESENTLRNIDNLGMNLSYGENCSKLLELLTVKL